MSIRSILRRRREKRQFLHFIAQSKATPYAVGMKAAEIEVCLAITGAKHQGDHRDARYIIERAQARYRTRVNQLMADEAARSVAAAGWQMLWPWGRA